jgi:CubicO group peptidase (beta-lactamase class C family)
MIKKTVLLFTFVSFYLTAFGQINDESFVNLSHSIDSILQKEVYENRIPGAVVLIKIVKLAVYQKAFGYAQKLDYNQVILEQPEKMTTGHLFDIASLTKVVGTTTAMMLLLDQGRFNIDDPVGKYIKAFDKDEAEKKNGGYFMQYGIRELNDDDILKRLNKLELKKKRFGTGTYGYRKT